MKWETGKRKHEEWDDVYCPRCGEPLGISQMPMVHETVARHCYSCNGKCSATRVHENLYSITYASTEYKEKP